MSELIKAFERLVSANLVCVQAGTLTIEQATARIMTAFEKIKETEVVL